MYPVFYCCTTYYVLEVPGIHLNIQSAAAAAVALFVAILLLLLQQLLLFVIVCGMVKMVPGIWYLD